MIWGYPFKPNVLSSTKIKPYRSSTHCSLLHLTIENGVIVMPTSGYANGIIRANLYSRGFCVARWIISVCLVFFRVIMFTFRYHWAHDKRSTVNTQIVGDNFDTQIFHFQCEIQSAFSIVLTQRIKFDLCLSCDHFEGIQIQKKNFFLLPSFLILVAFSLRMFQVMMLCFTKAVCHSICSKDIWIDI